MNEKILVTGISGYIGLHCAAEALRHGYRVIGSVRSLKRKEGEVRAAFKNADVPTENLEFVELDLTSDAGWDAAVEGCARVMHVASPFTIADPKSEDEVIVPAVEGTLRVMRAASKAGVARVVLTSSALAMMGSMKTGTFGPEDWTDVDAAGVSVYTKSKTLAEKAAWDFVKSLSEEKAFELVSVNPGGVMGPPIGKNISGQSMTAIDQMLKGKMPMLPRMGFPMVDVRDVAKLHVQALTQPAAAGRRFIAARSEPRGFIDVAQVLKDAGHKGPSTRAAPSFLLKFMALFDREARGMRGFLDTHLTADLSDSNEVFEWSPITFEQSILETADAVLEIQKSS